MTWAQRLKRVFNIDIETCEHCGGQVAYSGEREHLFRFNVNTHSDLA